ncbi:hypothetical protein ONE63_007030 [Megalurothrips usitatus]|uniref:Cytochrome P450 n=1 Tax=Megalurothrips usitatus TaxID=439358 RepID=A0AAV7XQR5_9NEOP|nr:hypothetical protein ONE63_007030 [Megalurothrips usitatus]
MAPVTAAIVAVLFAALGLLINRYLRAYMRFRKMELAIPGPPSVPVLGNALDFIGVKDTEMLSKILELVGDRHELSRVALLTNLVVFVNCAEDMEQVIKRKEFSDKAKLFYELFHTIAKRSVPLLNGEDWKMHRRALTPGFHKDVLDRFVDTFNQETKGFVKRVEPNIVCEPIDNMFRVGSRVFAKTMLTDEMDAEFESLIVSILRFSKVLLRDMNQRQMNPLLWPDFIYKRTATAKEVQHWKGVIDQATQSFLDQIRASLLDKDNKYPMTDEEIADEVKVFFGASVESTIAAQNIMLKILSLRQDIQEKIHAELTEVFGGTYRDVRPHDLSELHYTTRVISEVLRLYPSFPFVARQVYEETSINGYKLPGGTTVVLNIMGTHRDPKHWENPLVFDPDRFLPEKCEGRHPNAYMPFSTGPRNCIGGKYAMMNMKTFMSNVIRAFKIVPVDDGITDPCRLPITFDISLRIIGGTWVKFVPRTDIKIE